MRLLAERYSPRCWYANMASRGGLGGHGYKCVCWRPRVHMVCVAMCFPLEYMLFFSLLLE